MYTEYPDISGKRRATAWAGQAGVVLTWLYNGLWQKLIAASPLHQAVVAAVPGVPEGWARFAMSCIGIGECALAGAVIIGIRPWLVAVVQIVCVSAMSLGGLVWAADFVSEPTQMVVHNLAFCALILCNAELERPRS